MFFRKKQNKIISEINKFDKLNIGCGFYFIKGWLNIGIFPKKEIPYGAIRKINGASVFHFDITNEFPMKDSNVRYIYASHFIEHLSFKDGIKLLEKCYCLMENDAVMRLTFPDLELWVKNYYENNISFFEKYKSSIEKENFQAQTKGEIFMSQVHGWGHKWNWDFESMKHILGKIGFRNIEKKEAFDSKILNIKEIEPSEKGRLLETAYVEAIK